MQLTNPCSITNLVKYAESVKPDCNNDYIEVVYKELLKTDGNLNKNIVVPIFQLFLEYNKEKYIDVGCMCLALIILPFKHNDLYIDIRTGEIATSNDYKVDLRFAYDLANNLKQIIADFHLHMIK